MGVTLTPNETSVNQSTWENVLSPIFPIQQIVDNLYASRRNISKTNTVNVKVNDCKDKYYFITKLRKNHWYIVLYVFGSEVIFVEILPWVTVIILNLLTWRNIKTFLENRRRFNSGQSSGKVPTYKITYYNINLKTI